jgi:hypothetical protein
VNNVNQVINRSAPSQNCLPEDKFKEPGIDGIVLLNLKVGKSKTKALSVMSQSVPLGRFIIFNLS